MNALFPSTRISNYLDTFFDDTFVRSTSNYPPTDVYIEDDKLIFNFALAGFKKDDIKLDLDPETYYLTISSDSSVEENDNKKWISQKIAKRSFKITYQIPTCYNLEDVKAEMEDGVLNISFNKNPEKQKKLIEIL
jgi:HSP20 family molecular chaperone IbpA